MTLDQEFDVGTLHVLRKTVLAAAKAAGMPRDRAADVMIAVHELATNSVRHGAGTGRLRMHAIEGHLFCRVSDGGSARTAGDERGCDPGEQSWPVESGHGLWLVQQVADLVSVVSGPGGSEAIAVFSVAGSGADLHG